MYLIHRDNFDFVGEVEEAVSAADAAIIVVSGKAGVQVGTQKAWNLCEKYKLPRMFFVTDMDVDDVSYRKSRGRTDRVIWLKKSHHSISQSVKMVNS